MSIDINIRSALYGKVRVISRVTAQLCNGSFTALIGRNGSGKSTLAGAILSLVDYDGEILFDGVNARAMSARERALAVSGMLQSPKTPHVTVRELVLFGRNPHCSLRAPTPADIEAVERAITDADLSALRGAYLDEISGGELKRAYFAMLLAQDTKNIILDEATAFMDADYENSFLSMAKRLTREGGKTVLAVVHSLDLAVKYADNILLLRGGESSFFGTTEEALEKKVIERGFGVVRASIDGNNFFYVK